MARKAKTEVVEADRDPALTAIVAAVQCGPPAEASAAIAASQAIATAAVQGASRWGHNAKYALYVANAARDAAQRVEAAVSAVKP